MAPHSSSHWPPSATGLFSTSCCALPSVKTMHYFLASPITGCFSASEIDCFSYCPFQNHFQGLFTPHCSLFIFFFLWFSHFIMLHLICLMFVSPLNCLQLLEGKTMSFLFTDTSSVSRKLPDVPLVPNLLNELITE